MTGRERGWTLGNAKWQVWFPQNVTVSKKRAALDGIQQEKYHRLAHILLSCAEMWVLIMTGVDYKTFSNVTLLPFYIQLSKDQ